MDIEELRNKFIAQMEFYKYDEDMIEELANDVHLLRWINYLTISESVTIEKIFNDQGFHEFLNLQYDTPIVFEEMIEE